MSIFSLDSRWLGVRMWIWYYLFFSIAAFSFVLIWFFKERIRKKYYEIRYPEKLIRVVVHYKNDFFREYWRLIPAGTGFKFDDRTYQYSEKAMIRKEKGNAPDKVVIKVDGKEYEIKASGMRIKRFRPYPEIHYWYNSPMPIEWDFSKQELDFDSAQLDTFKDNDLWGKLLTLDNQNSMLMFILIISVINILVSIVLLAKVMGWLDKKGG